MKTTIKALLVFVSVGLFSCQQNDEMSSLSDLNELQLKSATIAANDVAVEAAADEATYESYFYGEYERLLRNFAFVKKSKFDLLKGKGKFHYVDGQAPVVSIDTAAGGYPITILIDYGTGIETHKGKVISGKVSIEISGPRKTDGTSRTVKFMACAIDSIGIDGVIKETFNGDNTVTRKSTFESDVTYTLPDASTVTRVGTSVREWLQGLDTPTDRSDDRIQTTGSILVSTSAGDKFIRLIKTPVIRLGDCKYPVEGTIQYTKNGTEFALLDYGSGECDNLATVTTDGTTVEIELKAKGMPKAKHKGHKR